MKEPTKKTRDNISSNLSHYMRLTGINNKELSRHLGVSESAVGKWLLKKTTPRMGMVEKIAAVFDVDVSDLLEERSELRSSLINDLRHLTNDQIAALQTVVDEFKKQEK